jgi:hypothetical protein
LITLKETDMSFDTMAPMTELEELESLYCEMHKDVHGVKARWYHAESVEKAREVLAHLEEALKIQLDHDKQAQQLAIAAFQELVKSYGFENAKCWQHQAYGTQGDDEFLCYRLGLPYGYFVK